MENVNTNPAADPVNDATQAAVPDQMVAGDEMLGSETPVSGDLAEQLEALRAERDAALAEREAARRHCQQKDNEMRALKRKNLSDPDAIEELEQELEQERIRLREETEAAQREFSIKSNAFDVRQVLTEAGVAGSDSVKLAGFITSEDLEESTARAKAIVSVINKVAKDKVKEATNTMLKDNAKEPPNGSAATETQLSPGAIAAQRYNTLNKNKSGGTT